jgi:hypothetical protein
MVQETLFKQTHYQNRAGEVAQGVGPEFKLKYRKQTNKQTNKKPAEDPGSRICLLNSVTVH